MKKWVFWVVALCLVSAPAWAQFRENNFAASLMVGPNILDTTNKFDDFNIDRAHQADFAVAFEYLLVKYVGIEVAGAVTWGDVDVMGGEVGYNFHNIYFHGNLVIHLLPDRTVVPYLTGGAGLVNMVPQRGKSVTKGAFNLGGGLDIFPSGENWSVRFEIRAYNYKFVSADFDDITRSDLNMGPDVDVTLWDTVVAIGFRYKF